MEENQIQKFRADFIKKLRNGVVSFHYRKKNGTLRKTRATLNLSLIPEEYHPKGFGKTAKDDTTPYFDLDKGAWRSFKLHRVTSIYL
jgi:hypothetical protein